MYQTCVWYANIKIQKNKKFEPLTRQKTCPVRPRSHPTSEEVGFPALKVCKRVSKNNGGAGCFSLQSKIVWKGRFRQRTGDKVVSGRSGSGAAACGHTGVVEVCGHPDVY